MRVKITYKTEIAGLPYWIAETRVGFLGWRKKWAVSGFSKEQAIRRLLEEINPPKPIVEWVDIDPKQDVDG